MAILFDTLLSKIMLRGNPSSFQYMKIARFNDDRVGVVRRDTHVVDVSDAISYRVEKGPQRVIEEVIEQFDRYRSEFERKFAQEKGG